VAALKCERCERLLSDYQAATAELINVAQDLKRVSLSWEMDNFMRLWQMSNQLHLKCTKLRREILRHLAAHQID
jgi:hypothetical protein